MNSISDTNGDSLQGATVSPGCAPKTAQKAVPENGDTPSKRYLTESTWRVCVKKPECLGGAGYTTISTRDEVRRAFLALAGGNERAVTDAMRYVAAHLKESDLDGASVSELVRARVPARLRFLNRLAEARDAELADENNSAWDGAQ